MLELRRGDIVLTRSRSWLARAIRSFAGEPVSHAGIVTTGGPINLARIVESDKLVRECGLLEKHAKDVVFVYRPLDVPAASLDYAAWTCERQVGQRYGYGEFFTQAFDGFFGFTVARRLNPLIPGKQCSTMVALAFSHVGLNFGVKPYAATPQDIARFCAAYTSKYQLLIGERLGLYVEDVLRQEASR